MTQYLRLQARLLSIVALTLFSSCQKTDENKLGMQASEDVLAKDQLVTDLAKSPTLKELNLKELDLEGIELPPFPENYQEIVKKYQVIADSKVRPIIDTIAHRKVLVGILDPETKREMPIPACFAEWNNQEVMFVPFLLVEEAALVLQDYYKRPNSNKVQIISVEKLEDWLQILKKAGYGIAADKTGVYTRRDYVDKRRKKEEYKRPDDISRRRAKTDYQDGGVNKFFYDDEFQDTEDYEWKRLCSRRWMHDAVDKIPRQEDIKWGEDWSCGPTSAAKAMHMFGVDMTEDTYIRFLRRAPTPNRVVQEAGMNLSEKGRKVFVTSVLLGMATAATGGTIAPLVFAGAGVASWGVGAGGAAANLVAGRLPTFGLRINHLAEHTTEYLPGTKRARYCDYNDWRACAKAIRDDIKRGRPVITLQTHSSTDGHYINVVGVKVDRNNSPVAFMLMNTDNRLYSLSYEDMEYLMKRQYASYKLLGGTSSKNYHMVRFYR